MAKIFYIGIKDNKDAVQAYFFNNEKKAQEKGLELYGVGITDFSFDLDGEEFEGDKGTQWIYSGVENVKDGFLFYQEDGDIYVEAQSEEDAEMNATAIDGEGAYFPAKLKGGYGECYIGSTTEHTNGLWSFKDGGDIYQEAKTTMRHIPTFESFINEKFRALEDKRFPVMTSFEVGFRDGKGKKSVLAYLDNSDESVFLNKKTIKDYEAAVKMTEAFVKKTKIKEKPIYDEPTMDSPGEIRLKLGQDDLPDRQAGKNLQPLYTQLSKLDTSESYTYKSEISQEIKDKDNDAYWDMAPDADKKELAKFYPNKK
jgi:hypothetical protein